MAPEDKESDEDRESTEKGKEVGKVASPSALDFKVSGLLYLVHATG
jgi:hypothetical protein